jgi:hypothetical protein
MDAVKEDLKPTSKKSEGDVLKEIKDRFQQAYDYWNWHYNDALLDLHFYDGDQWPVDLKRDRVSEGRPCLTINKLPAFVDQVIGDLRMNQPAIQVSPVDSNGDPETAKILSGLIRNIEQQSEAEVAYDTAAESAIICGYGYFRVNTQYADDDRFEQDIVIERIKNPFSVFFDPLASKFDRSDSRFCFVTEKMAKDDFIRAYGLDASGRWDNHYDRNPFWGDDKSIRIVEYWVKEPVQKKLSLFQNQNSPSLFVSDKPLTKDLIAQMEADGLKLVKTRDVESHRVLWYKATSSQILEGPLDWSGKYIPIIPVLGKELNIEGQTKYRGVIRYAKDSQQLYNYSRSTGAELTSLAPKSPYLVTSKQVSKYTHFWDNAHKRNFPYLPYDLDPSNPQVIPHRSEPIQASSAIQSEIMMSDQELHDTTGLQQASLGQKSNEKSGRAIMARQREGDVGSYAFYDNMGRSIKLLGRILIDLIPKVYDTARMIRVMEPDNKSQVVAVNQQMQPGFDPAKEAMSKIYDLTVGKYDVVVKMGPSYTTAREETAQNMIQFMQATPQAGMLIADLFAKSLDWPGAEEIEKRMKAMLPPQVQVAAGIIPPPKPDPMAEQIKQLQIKMAELEAALKQAEVEGKTIENEGKMIENRQEAVKLGRIHRGLPPEPQPPRPPVAKPKSPGGGHA